MNSLARWIAPICLASLVVAGCSNPASDVTAAKVGDAQPVPTDSDTLAGGDTGTALADPDAAAPAPSPSGEVATFDGESSKIDFVGSKLVGGSHDGGFKTFDGRFVLTPEGDSLKSVNVAIDMNSTWSDDEKLTGHLKNEDFFEVETYPDAEFVSTAITPDTSAGGTHEITGNLTLHGVTKSITIPATVAITDEAVSLDSEFKIDRTLWDIVYGAESDVRDRIINKDVVIRLDVDATRTSDTLAGEATE